MIAMTTSRFWKAFARVALIATSIALSTACATAAPRGRVYVRLRPPAPAGPGYVWIPGYHAWNGRAYVWHPGRWDRAPRRNARWVPARWVHDGRNGWYLVEGHWR